MKSLKSHLELIFPILLLISYLFALTVRNPYCMLIYMIIMMIVAIYFFPIRFLIQLKGKSKKQIMLCFFINCSYCATIYIVFLGTMMMKDFTFVKVIAIINLLLLLVGLFLIYWKHKFNNDFIIILILVVILFFCIKFNWNDPYKDIKPIYQIEEIDFRLFEIDDKIDADSIP